MGFYLNKTLFTIFLHLILPLLLDLFLLSTLKWIRIQPKTNMKNTIIRSTLDMVVKEEARKNLLSITRKILLTKHHQSSLMLKISEKKKHWKSNRKTEDGY